MRSRYARSTVEVRSRYPRSTLRSHLLRKELQPRLRRERAEKLACMARLIRPTEPRPVFRARFARVSPQYSPMTRSLLPRRSLMVCFHGSLSWFAHGSVTVRSRYAGSSLAVLSQYGVGTVRYFKYFATLVQYDFAALIQYDNIGYLRGVGAATAGTAMAVALFLPSLTHSEHHQRSATSSCGLS